MKTKKQWLGIRIGALTIGGLQWTELRGYRISLASWHNPTHMCWLWFIDAYSSMADEKRAFRFFHMKGAQARTILQLWNINIQFVWQAEGWYRNPVEYRQHRLAKQLGVKL